MVLSRSSSASNGAGSLLAFALILLTLFHGHGIVHFIAHVPGIEGTIRQFGWDKVPAVYWHLRQLLP